MLIYIITMTKNYIIDGDVKQAGSVVDALDLLLDHKFKPKKQDNLRLASLMREVGNDLYRREDFPYRKIIEKRCDEKGWDVLSTSYTWARRCTKRAKKMEECGSFLEFGYHSKENEVRLQHANFCKGRICPLCGWRRSLKLFGQLSQVVDKVIEENYAFIFMTLTVRDVPFEDLSGTIDDMMLAFKRMFGRKTLPSTQGKRGEPNPVYNLCEGYFKSLEITVNNEGLCHPHFHVLIAVKPDYFTSDRYLKTEDLSRVWGAFLKVNYNPIVDIRAPKVHRGDGAWKKNNKEVLKKAVREISKYCVKSSDVLKQFKTDIGVKRCLFALDFALYNRRLVGYGGVFKHWYEQLKLTDVEDIDEIDEMMNPTMADLIIHCRWNGMGWVKEFIKPNKTDE